MKNRILPAIDTEPPFDVLVLALFEIGDEFCPIGYASVSVIKDTSLISIPLVSSAKYLPPR